MAKLIVTTGGGNVWVNGVPMIDLPVLPHEVTAAPLEAWRMWYVRRPDAIDMSRTSLSEMSAAFARGENPFEGLLDARLWSVGMEQKWTAPTMHAVCCDSRNQTPDHGSLSPDRLCACGIWGLKDESLLWEVLNQYAQSPQAYGRVQLWGKWFEHERGYRAQYARPLEINVIGGEEPVLDELARFYGCPVNGVDPPEPLEELWMRQPTMMLSTAAAPIGKSARLYTKAVAQTSKNATISFQNALAAITNPIFSGNVTVTSFTAPTHGAPSTFLESSSEWTSRYDPDRCARDSDWQPGLFTNSNDIDVTSF